MFKKGNNNGNEQRMSSQNLIRIFPVSDYSILRDALRILLHTADHLRVIGGGANLQEAPDLKNGEKADAILIDLPDCDHSEPLSLLANSSGETPIIVLTSSSDTNVYQKCLQASIRGLVTKQKSASVLFKAIDDGASPFDVIYSKKLGTKNRLELVVYAS
ncbi:MAG: response regulator transcription factor [Acidobacteriota bacterium]